MTLQLIGGFSCFSSVSQTTDNHWLLRDWVKVDNIALNKKKIIVAARGSAKVTPLDCFSVLDFSTELSRLSLVS